MKRGPGNGAFFNGLARGRGASRTAGPSLWLRALVAAIDPPDPARALRGRSLPLLGLAAG